MSPSAYNRYKDDGDSYHLLIVIIAQLLLKHSHEV